MNLNTNSYSCKNERKLPTPLSDNFLFLDIQWLMEFSFCGKSSALQK